MRMIAKFRCGGEWEIESVSKLDLDGYTYVKFANNSFRSSYHDAGNIWNYCESPFDIIDIELVP